MKRLVGAFNQEKALVGAFSVIVKTDCETVGSSAALIKMGFLFLLSISYIFLTVNFQSGGGLVAGCSESDDIFDCDDWDHEDCPSGRAVNEIS